MRLPQLDFPPAAAFAVALLSLMVGAARAEVVYSEDFNDHLAQNWTLVSGTWSLPADGSLQNTSNPGGFELAIYSGASWATGFKYSVDVQSDFSGSGNTVGVVYNYVNATNYYDLWLSPAGTATLRARVNNVQTIVGTAAFPGESIHDVYARVEITRSGNFTTVKLNGVVLFENVPQTQLGAGNIGVYDGFNFSKFDNVVVETLPPPPTNVAEISISSNNAAIGDGSTVTSLANFTDFGPVEIAGGALSRTFNVVNTGDIPLHLGTVTIAGPNAADFTVTKQPATSVPAGGVTTFVVRFDPSALGVRRAMVSLPNDDTDENPFDFAISGFGSSNTAYGEEFNGPTAPGWTPLSGTWSVSGGTYSNTSSGSGNEIALYGANCWVTDYTLGARVLSGLTGASSSVGLVYNYVDASNYYEVLLGANGTAQIKRTINGAKTVQASASFAVSAINNTFADLVVERNGILTTVRLNGALLFNQISQPELGAGRVGVQDTANTSKFDDVSVTASTPLDRSVVTHGTVKETFPRLAMIANGNPAYENPAYQAQLAKFDLVITGFWKGWSRNGKNAQSILNELRTLNPKTLYANYTILESATNDPNNTAVLDIYRKLWSETGPNANAVLNDWWARDNTGAMLSNYGSTQETNITPFVQPDATGARYPQWAAKWYARNIFDLAPGFDAWFADNVYHKPRNDPDWDRDGVNDSQFDPAVQHYFRQAIADHLATVKEVLPQIKIVGNADGEAASGAGFLGDPEYSGKYEGALFESAIGKSFSPETWAGWKRTMNGYRTMMDNTSAPHLVILNTKVTPPDYRTMRYGLASCLLEDGYFAINNQDEYRTVLWYDEFNLDLGHAVEPPARAAYQNGVFVRRFERGMAIVNPKDNGAQTITIEPGYQRFRGTQDPATNNGTAVRTLTLGDREGLILVKGPAGNHDPVANAGPDQTVDMQPDHTATVTLDASATTDLDGDSLTYTWTWNGGSTTGLSPTITLPAGTTVVTLAVDDGKAGYATDTVAINVVDRTAPVIASPANLTLEATSPAGAAATFSATATDDVDGTLPVIAAPASGSTVPLGTTTVALTATDAAGNTGTASFTVTVRDTAAPTIVSVTPSQTTLWPPNHKMVALTLAVDAHDTADAAPRARIVSVSSNEPGADDWEVTGDLSLQLRAERAGGGNGRVYTITVECVDASGNRTTATTDVSVPHNQ